MDNAETKPIRDELIRAAGFVNNHRKLVNVDHVTFMGFLDRDEFERHVKKLRTMAGGKLRP